MTELEKLKEQLIKQGFDEKLIICENNCVEYKGIRFHHFNNEAVYLTVFYFEVLQKKKMFRFCSKLIDSDTLTSCMDEIKQEIIKTISSLDFKEEYA